MLSPSNSFPGIPFRLRQVQRIPGTNNRVLSTCSRNFASFFRCSSSCTAGHIPRRIQRITRRGTRRRSKTMRPWSCYSTERSNPIASFSSGEVSRARSLLVSRPVSPGTILIIAKPVPNSGLLTVPYGVYKISSTARKQFPRVNDTAPVSKLFSLCFVLVVFLIKENFSATSKLNCSITSTQLGCLDEWWRSTM